jgi:uncharacterized protein (TIGR02466 family)
MLLHTLFPSPVAFFEYDQPLSSSESAFVKNQPTRRSMGNTMTSNVSVLNCQELVKIRDFIQSSLDTYFENVYKPKTNCKLEITQSWINFTEPGEYHHRHDHPNSLLSGVFYIEAEENVDSIFFFNRDYRQIQIAPREHNVFNSDSWQFSVKKNDLIIFPSSLTHMVTTTKSVGTRISLAFNTFVSGDIGDVSGLTNLQI